MSLVSKHLEEVTSQIGEEQIASLIHNHNFFMKRFKIRLRFTHSPAYYENPMLVFINDDIANPVGSCSITEEKGEIIGNILVDEEIDENMFVYYRHNLIDDIYHAVQFRDKQLPNKEGLTIAELLR